MVCYAQWYRNEFKRITNRDKNMLDDGKNAVELRVVTDEKKMAKDVSKRDTIVRGLFVPENMGAELATRYKMSPDAEVGRHIHKLMVALSGVKMGTQKLTKSQAQQIMLIVLSGILYGTYEFGKGIDNEDIKSAVGYLSEDVNDLQTCLGQALSESDSEEAEHFYSDYSLNTKISGYIGGYTFNRPKQKSLKTFGTFLKTYYYDTRGKVEEGFESDKFFKDYGRVLCRHIQWGTFYDSRKSIDDIKYSGAKVREVCDLINAVKKMGNEYVIAPAVNLYALALDATLTRSYEKHKAHWAYQRGGTNR